MSKKTERILLYPLLIGIVSNFKRDEEEYSIKKIKYFIPYVTFFFFDRLINQK